MQKTETITVGEKLLRSLRQTQLLYYYSLFARAMLNLMLMATNSIIKSRIVQCLPVMKSIHDGLTGEIKSPGGNQKDELTWD
jgi:hypothetical protein